MNLECAISDGNRWFDITASVSRNMLYAVGDSKLANVKPKLATIPSNSCKEEGRRVRLK